MAICAHQFEIAAIGFPILEAARPNVVAVFGATLLRGIAMVNVERSEIREAATHTLAAKFINERDLAFPMPIFFVQAVAIIVPIILLAARSAKLRLACLPALAAIAVATPSRGKIAALTTILAGALAKTIGVHFRGLAAVRASDNRWGCSHADYISQYYVKIEPKYFDISCRRISEALRQPDLFIENPKPAKQEAFL